MAGNKKRGAPRPAGQNPRTNTQSSTSTRRQAAQTQQSSVQPHPEQANEIPKDSSSITTGLPAKQPEPAEAIRDRPSGARTPIEVKPSTKNSQRKKANFDDLILQEMGRRVHFLPIEDFFEKFAPSGSDSDIALEAQSRRVAQEAAEKILKVDLETKMYPILCAAFAQVLKGTKHIIVDTAEDNEDGDKDLKPDLTMYNKEIGSRAWDIKPKTKSDRQDYRGRVAWSFAEMFMEVKRSNQYNPFDGQSLRGSQLGMKTFEQITKVAIESLNLQHRTFLFTAFIVETKARLLRWDRAGVVVSEEFDIGAEPGWLFNFVHRVATSGREAQGFDTTVTDADEGQIKKLDDFRKKQDNKYAQEYLEEMNMNRTLYPIQQLQCDIFEFAKKKIDDPESPQYSALRKKKRITLLIGHICFAHSSLSGRGTKGFVAFVVDVDRLVFLKESWRPVNTSRLVREEGDIYRDLTGAGVPYIPFAIAGGDVSESHVTLNGELLSASQRQQYRLVLWEVGIPLDRHANSFALIRSLHHALKAHRFAWENAGILHRDISPGNVLIDMLSPPNAPMGLLCDWELSKKKTELTEGATQHTRSGTWITLSAVSLQYPYKPIELSDDLESFYHLLTYNILRFYRHSMTKSTTAQLLSPLQNDSESALAQHVWNYYYAHIRGIGGDPDTGGTIKWMALRSVEPPFRLLDVESPLNRLLEDVHTLCFKHYQTVRKQDLDKYSPFSAQTATTKKPFVLPAVDLDDINFLASKRPEIESPPTTSNTSTKVTEDRASPVSPLTNHDDMYLAFLSILQPRKGDTLDWDLDDKIDDQFVNLPSFIGVADKKSSATRTKSSVGSSSRRSRSANDDGGEEQPDAKRQKTEGSGLLSPIRE